MLSINTYCPYGLGCSESQKAIYFDTPEIEFQTARENYMLQGYLCIENKISSSKWSKEFFQMKY